MRSEGGIGRNGRSGEIAEECNGGGNEGGLDSSADAPQVPKWSPVLSQEGEECDGLSENPGDREGANGICDSGNHRSDLTRGDRPPNRTSPNA